MAEWQNNGKIKLLIIVGTRPEIIRLSAVIKKCRKYFDTILCHTGQNYDYNLNGVFFKDVTMPPAAAQMITKAIRFQFLQGINCDILILETPAYYRARCNVWRSRARKVISRRYPSCTNDWRS